MLFKVDVKKRNFYRQYVKIINAALELSVRELDILAALLEVDMTWDRKSYKDIIDKGSRREIRAMTLVNRHNLSRYIKTFKEKNIVVSNGNGWEINKALIPKMGKKVKVTFNINVNE